MIIISAVCKIYLNVSKNLFCINFRHLNLRAKDSFGTKFSFYNDFKGANTSGHEMSHFCENSSIASSSNFPIICKVFPQHKKILNKQNVLNFIKY